MAAPPAYTDVTPRQQIAAWGAISTAMESCLASREPMTDLDLAWTRLSPRARVSFRRAVGALSRRRPDRHFVVGESALKPPQNAVTRREAGATGEARLHPGDAPPPAS